MSTTTHSATSPRSLKLSGLRMERSGVIQKMGRAWTAGFCRPWQRKTRESMCITRRRSEWVCAYMVLKTFKLHYLSNNFNFVFSNTNHLCSHSRSRYTWKHWWPLQWAPPVRRSTTIASAGSQTSTIAPQLALAAKTESTLPTSGPCRAAWQRQGLQTRTWQGANVRGPGCDKDSAGEAQSKGGVEFIHSVIYLFIFFKLAKSAAACPSH